MPPIRTIGFIVNASKTGALELAGRLAFLAKAAGVESRQTSEWPVADNWLAGTDLGCVIGGDGTLLGAVPAAVRAGVPLLGINLGKLGFTATYSAEETAAQFPRLLRGDFTVSHRILLQCSPVGGGTWLALNDLVVRSQTARLCWIEVRSSVGAVNSYFADGLIIATPTGSTAYNLSAGGPIVHPEARVLAMTPICPHTLSNRGVIFDDSVELEINFTEPTGGLQISVDGREAFTRPAAPITVKRAAATLALVNHHYHTHFDLLRSKLGW